jgi:hypothetical protein
MSNNRYHKTLSLALTQTALSCFLSFALVGCSVVTKNIQSASSSKGRTDPKAVKSDPAFHHGFGGDPDTFKLIDRMDTSELANLVKDEEVAKKIQTGPKPSLIYTGKSLGLKDCSIAPNGANHIAEIWRQEYLVNLFVAPGLGIQKAMESLQEVDARGSFRPFSPVHPKLIERLKGGSKDDFWVLNAIRFRISDPSSVDVAINNSGGLERQSVPVMGQIKLNYELDRYAAKTDATIASASFIHSIAINQEYIGEFIKDVFSIKQDPNLSGCEILALLNKYIRSQGLKVGQTPRGSYFFLHTNIFDTQSGINEWRFTEHKLVTDDVDLFSEENYVVKRRAFLSKLKEAYDNGNLKYKSSNEASSVQASQIADDSILTSCPRGFITCPTISMDPESKDIEASLPENLRNIQLGRQIMGAHDSPVGIKHPNLSLRLTKMIFPRHVVNDDFNHLELAQDKEPLNIWFSGTLTDFGKNPTVSDVNYDLITLKNGAAVDGNHPVRRHEETKTCAQCHASNHDTSFDPKSLKLGEIASMNFRHIGFGDGGNRRCNPFFGLVRGDFKASLSTYLLKTANGFDINGYSSKAVRKVPDKMAPFAAFNGFSNEPETGIDVMRCFNVDGSKDSVKP